MKTRWNTLLAAISLGLFVPLTGYADEGTEETEAPVLDDTLDLATADSDGAQGAIAAALSKALAVGGGNAVAIANAFSNFVRTSPYSNDPCVAKAMAAAFATAYGGGDAVAVSNAVAGVAC